MTTVEPEHWISLGALLVAAVSVVTSGWFAPKMAARLAESGRIRDERSAAYADGLRLLRARMRDLERSSYGWPIDHRGPDDEEAARITARLLVCASGPVWEAFHAFFRVYNSTQRDQLFSDIARVRAGDDVAARLRIGRVHDDLEHLMDETADRMRTDLGTGRFMVELTQRRKRPAEEPPATPTSP
jgi:hypothetical protein